MNRLVTTGLLAMGVLSAVFADTVDPSHETFWRNDLTEGVYNDPASWTDGVVPANGSDGHYGVINFQTKDVTVRVPAEGLLENSGTIFIGTGVGTHTLTIDTRGTSWEKRGVKSINDWWCSPFAMNLTGSHVFNFEGCAKNTANNDLVWKFTDALFGWTSTASTRQDFDLRSGTFSFGKPLYLGSNGGNVNFVIHPEATLDASSSLQQRGNATTHTTFLGGRHRLNGICLKDLNSAVGRTWLHVTNDAVVVDYGALWIGYRSAVNVDGRDGLSTGYLDLTCTARMDVTNGVYIGSGNAARYNLRNEGFLTMSDDTSFYSHYDMVLGDAQASTGTVTLLNRAVVSVNNRTYFGNASNAVGRLVMSGDTVYHSRGVFRPGSGLNGTGVVELRDRAQLDVGLATGSWLSLGTGTGSAYGRLAATDDVVVTLGANAALEMTLGGAARAEIDLSGHAQIVGGNNSYVTNRSEIVGNTSVTLSGDSRLLVKGVYGADPVAGGQCMSFVGDGGTLVAHGSVNAAQPFLYGCVGTLKAGGLGLDTQGFNLSIDQDFTAADGAVEAAFVKMGNGDLTVLRSSSHPCTRVEKGSLVFGTGVTRFGRKLELASGATLALGDASTVVTGRDRLRGRAADSSPRGLRAGRGASDSRSWDAAVGGTGRAGGRGQSRRWAGLRLYAERRRSDAVRHGLDRDGGHADLDRRRRILLEHGGELDAGRTADAQRHGGG